MLSVQSFTRLHCSTYVVTFRYDKSFIAMFWYNLLTKQDCLLLTLSALAYTIGKCG